MKNDERNAYMRNYMKKRFEAMTPTEQKAYRAHRQQKHAERVAADPTVKERRLLSAKKCQARRKAAMTPAQKKAFYEAKMAAHRARMAVDPEYAERRRAIARRHQQKRYPVAGKKYYEEYRDTLKKELMAAYGTACVCCGEDEPTFLSLDHINGDGAEERRRGAKAGYWFYLELRKRGFPSGYQTLCFNCNFAKKQAGECPHRKLIMHKITGNLRLVSG